MTTTTNHVPECARRNEGAKRPTCYCPRTAAPVATAAQIAQAEALEARARGWKRTHDESWERSDTDGFLTQWAANLSQNECAQGAEILRNGGVATFWGLYDTAAGERVRAKLVTSWDPFRHGATRTQWQLDEARDGRRYLPATVGGRVIKALGLEMRLEWAPAECKTVGRGHGLSGRAWTAVVRTDGLEVDYTVNG